MRKTVAETIKDITRNHLQNGGVAMGQCLSAVGWVGGTVPELKEEDGLLELSMDDTSGSGIAVGYALAGRRPIFICRYQGFMWLDGSMFANYAAKSRELRGIPCPVFIRAIAMEGGIGPVAGSSHHGMFTRMPGLPVCAPMTPLEYRNIWRHFIAHKDPLYVSEHRRSFAIDYEMPNHIYRQADITLMPISAARLNTLEAVKLLVRDGLIVNVIHLVWLKPLYSKATLISNLESSRYGGLVIDTDFENGISKCIAYDLMQACDKKVRVLGLEERTAGFAPHLDNLPPSPEKIYETVKKIIRS